jgi:heptaprenyl diphosphate synthase/octaprenyl-diphosphate synthase
LSLDIIYGPIREDLAEVETRLRAIAEVSYPRLAQLLGHSLKSGGKRVRPALVLLSAKFYDYDLGSLLPMAVAVEVLHTATLVHDDAIDHSPLRRGKPTINELWGEDKAILLGDYLLAQAEELVSQTQNLSVIRLFARAIMTLASGELAQAFTAFNLEQTREHYFARVAAKTASLLTLATESGAILSRAPEKTVAALKDYGHNLGIAFQIVDDILDFIGDEAEMGKPTGSDLSEGTLTLPAMMALERYPEENPIKRLFSHQGDRQQNLRLAIELVKSSGVLEECYQLAQDYSTRAGASLEALPANTARNSLEELARYVVARRK